MHSLLVRCLLALILLLGQAANVLHAFEHLVPPSGTTADRAESVPSSSPVSATAVAGMAIDGGATDGATTGRADGATTSEHVDDGSCTLCLLLGAGHAPTRPPDGGPLPVARVIVIPAGVAIAIPPDRAQRLPPARGPPTLS